MCDVVPQASSPDALRRMRSQRRRDTRPEIELRRELHRIGLRFRVDHQVLPSVRRRADVVFTRAHVAVFVDGCFWHRCPQHGTMPKANAAWWSNKLAANAARDRDTDLRLQAAGWTPLRVWEHEAMHDAAQLVRAVVNARQVGTAVSPGPR